MSSDYKDYEFIINRLSNCTQDQAAKLEDAVNKLHLGSIRLADVFNEILNTDGEDIDQVEYQMADR